LKKNEKKNRRKYRVGPVSEHIKASTKNSKRPESLDDQKKDKSWDDTITAARKKESRKKCKKKQTNEGETEEVEKEQGQNTEV